MANTSWSSAPLDGLVRRLRLHSALAERDAEAIRALRYTLKTRLQASQLVWEGESTKYCMVLVSGMVHRFRTTADGFRQILTLYLPGDPIDFDHLFLPVADDGLQVTRESELAYIPQADLRQLMKECPPIADAITRALLVDASIFREWTMNVGRRDAKTRIAHLLCEISERLRAQGFDFAKEPVPLTQDQIADATGLTPVHVNRTLKALSAERAIRRRGVRVMLPDPSALRELADFSPRYLHLANGTSE